MIEINVNNGEKMIVRQDRENIEVKFGSNGIKTIPEHEFVMLMNYYAYIKNNNLKCDFINPKGVF